MPREDWEKSLDWTRSNRGFLFDIGYETAKKFLVEDGFALPRRP